MQLLGIEMPLKEFDALIMAQNNGKELKVQNNKVVAVDHIPTENEIKQQRIVELNSFLSKTDYVVTKLAEMQISNNENFSSELARYQETIQNRVAWRSELDRLLNE